MSVSLSREIFWPEFKNSTASIEDQFVGAYESISAFGSADECKNDDHLLFDDQTTESQPHIDNSN